MTDLWRREFMKMCALLPQAAILAARPSAWSAARDNEVVLNLEPNAANPRNSEGSFVTLRSGRILFFYTQFYGGSYDKSPARIAAVHSDDQGRTWSVRPGVVLENVGRENVMSVSLLRLAGGKIAFFYLVKNGIDDCRPRMKVSADEAETWSEPRLVIEAPGYFVLNNDRVVQLQSGRLIVPVAYHRMKGADPGNYSSFDGRAISLWYLSDDEGQTWRESADWWAIGVRSRTGLQEPGVVELAGGHLLCWARTDQGAQYGMFSTDGGNTWSTPTPTALQSPVSPASIKRLPDSTELLAVYNDHSGRFPYQPNKRTPLLAAVSRDGGATWPVHKLLEEDPDGWYCYTAIHYSGDAALLGYCAGDHKVGGLNRLRIRRISLDWLRRS